MKLPLSWLNDYTTVNITPEEYCDKMTMSGSKVEGYEKKGDGIENVVVGKILKIEKHPDADKLRICSVDVGKEVIQIVTGAANVQENDVIPVALVGAKLPGGSIKAGKLRGVDSFGMMCSTDELGLSEERATGIMILNGDYPLGTDIKEALNLNDCVVEFEITSNRPDCLGVVGIARETAATLNEKFELKKPQVKDDKSDNINNYIKVNVADSTLCPRYIARVVKDVKIGPSPEWLQNRLNLCGVRSINNIVDITNYIMLEYCQPMHAFDIRDLEGGEINVRRAQDDEKITTLDGIERNLNSSMLVIADAKKAVAVAGVMGGENSEVKDDTTTIVFESANFMGTSVRKTAQKLGLRTESSGRYEKGLDPQSTYDGVQRACELINMLGCGTVVSGIIDIDNSPKVDKTIQLRPECINKFLGTQIKTEDMTEYLTRLGFFVDSDLNITVPTFRTDIECEADIAEEIARIYGYDKITSTLLKGETTEGRLTPEQKAEEAVKNILTGDGFYEIQTYSFTSPKIFDKLLVGSDSYLRKTVTITNPLGEDNSVMRTTSVGSMLEILAGNYNHRVENARLFEIAKIYTPEQLPLEKLPEEKNIITLGMYGNDYDFYDLKGSVEILLEGMGIKKYTVMPVKDNTMYHPGKTAGIYVGKALIATLGEIHPSVCKNFEIETPAYVAEIDLSKVLQYRSVKKSYLGLPKFPAVTRDIAMLVDDSILVADIESIIVKYSKHLLENIKLFDVYKGKQIPEGKKSVAYSIQFRASDRTLKDDEIDEIMKNIFEGLKSKLNAELR